MLKLQEEVEESSTSELAFEPCITAGRITLARHNQDLNLFNTQTDVNVKTSFFITIVMFSLHQLQLKKKNLDALKLRKKC